MIDHNVEDISFTDINGKTRPVKDIRALSNLETGIEIRVGGDIDTDELISRNEYYGKGNEDLNYAIIEHNIVKLVEENFNISGLKKIKMPIIEE